MRLTSIWLWCLACSAAAQEPPEPPAEPEPLAATIDRWVDSAHDDEALLQRAAARVVEAGRKGFELVAASIATVEPDDLHRRRGFNSLVQNSAISFLQQQANSGMVYAGQYGAIAPLQPFVGILYLQLVIDTPPWFPENLRPLVVPALRDLFPKGPDRDALAALRDIAADRDFETEGLRYSLALAMAQWGDRSFLRDRIEGLERDIDESDAEDRLPFLRQLAILYYQVRDYATAVTNWRRYLRGSEQLGLDPTPEDYYNAACSLALAGARDHALDELERGARLMKSGTVDESLLLDEKLFREDPEIESLRPDPRFAKIVETLFGSRGDGKDSKPNRDGDR